MKVGRNMSKYNESKMIDEIRILSLDMIAFRKFHQNQMPIRISAYIQVCNQSNSNTVDGIQPIPTPLSTDSSVRK